MEPVLGKVTLEARDFRQASLKLRLWLLVVPVIFLAPMLTTGDSGWVSVVIFIAVMIGLVLAVLVLHRVGISAALSNKRPEELCLEYRFEQDSFRISSGVGTNDLRYEALHGVTETASAFILNTGGVAIVVPKRAFPEADLARLRERLLQVPVRRRPIAKWLLLVLLGWLALIAIFLTIWQVLTPESSTEREPAGPAEPAAEP